MKCVPPLVTLKTTFRETFRVFVAYEIFAQRFVVFFVVDFRYEPTEVFDMFAGTT